MSEQIDWGNAPEGATHYVPAPNDLHHPIWLKMEGGTVLNAGYMGHAHWAHTYTRGSQPCTDLSNAIARPSTPSWSGEGLPPVCEFVEFLQGGFEWRQGMVICCDMGKVIIRHGEQHAVCLKGDVRPLRAPEQIAADERKAEAVKMFGIYCEAANCNSASIGGFLKLYDAGLRFTKP